ncbi:MAG: hypothetical protein MZV63_46550 [Marinilabiliales bacterium]|nr:hypothetical protein [Marinilabiliales bacterium]
MEREACQQFSTGASGTAIISDRRLGEWNTNYGSSATKRKIYIGKITNYFTKLNVAEIKLENGDLSKGDTILITGPTTGVVEYIC